MRVIDPKRRYNMSNNSGANTGAKKKNPALIIIIILVIAALIVAGQVFEANKVYNINSAESFVNCFNEGFGGNNVVESYALSADITLSGDALKNQTTLSYDKAIEAGDSDEEAREKRHGSDVKTIVIDGRGHTVKNLTITGYNASLLGDVYNTVVIKNITFDNLTVEGTGYVGGLISHAFEGSNVTFENVKIINSNITSSEEYATGGLIGWCNKSYATLKDCTVESSSVLAVGATNVGGLVGRHVNAVQENSVITGCENIQSAVKGYSQVGGLIGQYCDEYVDVLGMYGDDVDEELIEFKELKNSGPIRAENSRVGGIIGHLSYTNKHNIKFISCVTEVDLCDGGSEGVVGVNSVGGILGGANYNASALVVATGARISFTDCINNQMVQGYDHNGGIVGYIDDKMWAIEFSGCKNTEMVCGGSKVGGIVGTITGGIIGGEQFKFTDCENSGSILTDVGELVGGILGYVDDLNPLFTRCKNVGGEFTFIRGAKYVGGISGRYGIFVDCENSMNIKSTIGANSLSYIGGIVGDGGKKVSFTNCKNSGNILNTESFESAAAAYVGGIAGYTGQLVLTGCENSGEVMGNDCVGGLVGKSDATWGVSEKNTLKSCTVTGNVYAFGQSTASPPNYTNDDVDDIKGKVGMLIGSFGTGTLIFDFTDIEVNGTLLVIHDTDYIGGICGYMTEGSIDTLKGALGDDSTIGYTVSFSQHVSATCKDNIKLGEDVFEDSVTDFNNPTMITDFVYGE